MDLLHKIMYSIPFFTLSISNNKCGLPDMPIIIAGEGVPWLIRAQFCFVPLNNFSSSSSCLRIEKLRSLRRLNTAPMFSFCSPNFYLNVLLLQFLGANEMVVQCSVQFNLIVKTTPQKVCKRNCGEYTFEGVLLCARKACTI